ncbi:hypothetical protein LTR85_001767 [Meristemomyces frigidus]|nr:hypothetical protein LTR85_001767 [Meristemomyces frigidus]
MPSRRHLILLTASASAAFGGPLRRFDNGTVSDGYNVATTTSFAGSAVLPIVVAPSTSTQGTSVASTTATATDVSTSTLSSTSGENSVASNNAQALVATESVTSFSFSYAPAQPNTTVAGSSTFSSSVSQPGNGSSPAHGTTTLTLYTTVPPNAVASATTPSIDSTSSGASLTMASSGASVSSSKEHVSSSAKGATTTSPADSSQSGSDASSLSTIAHSSSVSITSQIEAGSSTGTASAAVYGSLTLTYSASADSATLPTTLTPMSTYISSSVVGHTSAMATQSSAATPSSWTHSSMSFVYPLPDTSSTLGTTSATSSASAASTADPVQASDTSHPFFTYSAASTSTQGSPGSTGRPTGLPDIVSQASGQGASASTIRTSSSGVAGITIVPVNPNAVTVTVTTTELDAGKTTTVAEKTVTVSA